MRLGEEGDRAKLDGLLIHAPQEREMRVLVDRIGGELLELLLRDEAVLRLLQLEQPLVLDLLRGTLDLPHNGREEAVEEQKRTCEKLVLPYC